MLPLEEIVKNKGTANQGYNEPYLTNQNPNQISNHSNTHLNPISNL
jgi:hypothetical protein